MRLSSAAQRRGVTSQPDWIETAGRAGYAAKGFVYVAVGGFATLAAIGSGSTSEGSRAALREIAQQPFGRILLGLTGIGLLGYVVWRIIQARYNPSSSGNGWKGLVKRIGYGSSAVVNLALAWYALQVSLQSAGSGGSKQEWTARLLAQPFGPWLVGAVGLAIIGAGLHLFYKAHNARFMKHLKSGRMSLKRETIVKRTGQFGLPARGVAFLLIGGFVVQAAIQTDPQEVEGLGAAFQTLANQPYGPWLMGVVAVGFVAYGVYCFMLARHRRFRTG
jgi:hypothetical protein